MDPLHSDRPGLAQVFLLFCCFSPFNSRDGTPDDPNAAEVVKINSGQLYLIRPGNIRSSRECMCAATVGYPISDVSLTFRCSSSYNEAMATIRRIPSMEHHFQLVITRVYEDGDQELIEDEDESALLGLLKLTRQPY
jgi:hypothetical protein